MKINEAVIFAGGKGTRIRNFKKTPKPLIKVNKKEIISHVIDILTFNNINKIFILVGYKKKDFLYLQKKYSKSNISVKVIDTGVNSTTGQRLMMSKKYIKGLNFVATYGDSLANFNLKKSYATHMKNKNIVTMCIYKKKIDYGNVKIENNKISYFEEKPYQYINAGFYVINKEIFNYKKKLKNFETKIINKILKSSKLGFKYLSKWHPMDYKKDYLSLRSIIKKEKNFFKF
tara:strand:- start:3044 stop:3736 length:693 start_codon:yes stop_codon:yes gene_type:complete